MLFRLRYQLQHKPDDPVQAGGFSSLNVLIGAQGDSQDFGGLALREFPPPGGGFNAPPFAKESGEGCIH